MKILPLYPMLFLSMPLCAVAAGAAPTLPVTQTPVARLALLVVPDSLVISPDSARVALAAKAGDLTLADRGVFLGSDDAGNPGDDSPDTQREQVRFYLDDRSGAAFDLMSVAVFSPDSKHVAFAGLRDKHWHVVIDKKTVAEDGEDLPAVPIAFSPDSATAAWVVKRGGQFFVTVGENRWPGIEAVGLSAPLFSPDSRHVAIAAHRGTTWTLYLDGKPLPFPDPPATLAGRQGQSPHFNRFAQLAWRPDSAALACYAAFPGAGWQCFVQAADGKVLFASPPADDIPREPPIFSADSQHFAFAAENHKQWSIFLDGNALPGRFEQLLPAGFAFLEDAAQHAAAHLVALARDQDHWHLLRDGVPVGAPFDAIVQNSFVTSPDRRHFAFAGVDNHQTQIIRDGAVLATSAGAAAATFAFSPDSRHFAYAIRGGADWCACVDGTVGASFAAMGATRIAFSPDSSRIAYIASTGAKSWHLVAGLSGEKVSKPFEGFLKGTRVNWRPDGTIVTLAIEKKVAMRIEATP